MNATELIADVKRKAQIDSGQETLSDSDILDLATKELQTVICPKILSVRENFLATYKDFTITTARSYRIPFEATGGKILAVEIVDITTNDRRRLAQIGMMENPPREGFYIRSGSVILSPLVTQSGTLRIHYCARPGTLSETVKYVLTLDDNFTIQTSAAHGLSAGAVVSIQKGSSPFEYVQQNVTISAVPAADLMEFANDLNALGVSVGDFVTVTATSSTSATAGKESTAFAPQIPIELHDWLGYRTACRVLEHIGHSDLLQSKLQKVDDIEKDILALINPRVDDAGKIIFEKELLGASIWW